MPSAQAEVTNLCSVPLSDAEDVLLETVGPTLQRCAAQHLRRGVFIAGRFRMRVHFDAAGDASRVSLFDFEPEARQQAMLQCLEASREGWHATQFDSCGYADLALDLSSEIELSERTHGEAAVVELHGGQRVRIARTSGVLRFEVRTTGLLTQNEARRAALLPFGAPLEQCFAEASQRALAGDEPFDLATPLVLRAHFRVGAAPTVYVEQTPSAHLGDCARSIRWGVFEAEADIGPSRAVYTIDSRNILHPSLLEALDDPSAGSASLFEAVDPMQAVAHIPRKYGPADIGPIGTGGVVETSAA